MKTAVVFVILIDIVLSGLVPENGNGVDGLNAQVDPNLQVDESSIIFWFFSQENPSNGVAVNTESLSSLTDTSFTTDLETYFIIHGWQNTNTSDFVTTVREAILRNLNVNVFVLDWGEIAAQDYTTARNSVPAVGNSLVAFIRGLMTNYTFSLIDTIIIGYCLGAHVASFARTAVESNDTTRVIVGLDPALPLFETTDEAGRLDPNDALFVQVIHTNGGLNGFLSPIGGADYYPNGGTTQPGCGLDLDGSCSHNRAWEYYAESLDGGNFIGVLCNSYAEYLLGLCDSAPTSVMGTTVIDASASGTYYLDTNSAPPYAQG